MSYIQQMSEKELTYFTKTLSPKLLRRVLKKHLPQMQEIKPGLQPDQLSDASLVAFYVKNRDVDVLRDFLDLWITYNIQMTQETRNNLIKKGKSEDEAMARALLKYGFREQISLYYKLTGTNTTPEYIRLLEYTISILAANEKVEPASIPVEWSLENQKAFEQWIDSLTAEYETKLTEAEKERKEARVSLDETRRELSKIKSQLIQAENGKSSLQQTLNETKQQLNEAQDKLTKTEEAFKKAQEEFKQKEEELSKPRGIVAPVMQPGDTEEEKTYQPSSSLMFMSVCRPYVDDRGTSRLMRLADVNEKGEILDKFVEAAPPLFRLYQKDGPEESSYIGVWDWKSVPNLNNPTRQYLICVFHEHMEPVEVINAGNVHSVAELLENIKTGIERQYAPDRMLYVYFNGVQYEGVYITYNQLNELDGRMQLNTDVQSLPLHRISPSDIIQLDKENYYRFIDLPKPVGMVTTREYMETVRSIVLAKAFWPVMKMQGVSRTDFKVVRDFLSSVPTSDVIDRVASACECSKDEAKELVNQFIASAERYMKDITVGREDTVQLIRNTPALMDQCFKTAEEMWETQNAEKLREAEAHLSELSAEAENRQGVINARQQELNQIEAQMNATQKETMALEAQMNAARVQTMNLEAQIQAYQAQIKDLELQAKEAEKSAAERKAAAEAEEEMAAASMPVGSPMFSPFTEPGFIDDFGWQNGEMMINTTWKDALVSIEIALLEAGVAQYALDGLAACLYAAYLSRIPVMIAGPNSFEIARAFTIAVECREPAIMRTGTEPAWVVARRCKDSRSGVVVVQQALDPKWNGDLFELLVQREKFFICVQPFAEDLKEAPRGLLNYCLPILTELFVEKAPGNNYRGAQNAEEFMALPNRPMSTYHDNFLRMLRVSGMTKNNLDRLLTDMHALLETTDADNDYLFLLYPLAYMTSTLSVLKDNLGKTQTDSPVSMGIRNFLTPYLRDD